MLLVLLFHHSMPKGCENQLGGSSLLIKLSKTSGFPVPGCQDGSRENLPSDLTGLGLYSLRFPLVTVVFITINVPTDGLAVHITAYEIFICWERN